MKKMRNAIIGVLVAMMVALPAPIAGESHLLIDGITEIKDERPIDDVLEEIFTCPDDQTRVCTSRSYRALGSGSARERREDLAQAINEQKERFEEVHHKNVKTKLLKWFVQNAALMAGSLADGPEGMEEKELSESFGDLVKTQCKDAVLSTKKEKGNDFFKEEAQKIFSGFDESISHGVTQTWVDYTAATCICLKIDACQKPPIIKTKFGIYLKEGFKQPTEPEQKTKPRRVR